MTHVNFKKGSAYAAVLLLLMPVASATAANFKTTYVGGTKIKSAVGCKWSEDGIDPASYKYLSYKGNKRKTQKTLHSLDQCISNYCVDDPTCIYWMYLVPNKSDASKYSECFSLDVDSQSLNDSYKTIGVPDNVDPKQSLCGYLTFKRNSKQKKT